MRNDILHMLLHGDGYVSGEAISRELGISRAAVWKNIRALKEDGAQVEAHTNKGYRLLAMPDVLRPQYIGQYIQKPENMIKWLGEVDSTNTYAKKLARDGAPGGTVVVAESQTGGKGRRGRAWASAAGESVLMSFIQRPHIHPQLAPVINIAVALGVVDGIQDACGIATGIKWPNDVVYNGKKLCGILTEMSSDMDVVEYVVCGMGVNVNQPSFAEELGAKAVSLRMILGERVERVRLAAALIGAVEGRFACFLEGGMAALRQEYAKKSVILGRHVRVLDAHAEHTGVCTGFGDGGELILNTNGETRVFHAGDISVRGEEGYV